MAKKNTLVPPTVPLELWKDLYASAARFQRLAPWQWMDDAHAFCINNQHGVRMVATMGKLGDIFGIASYRGSTGINFLLRLLNGEAAPEDSNIIFQQDALTAQFVPLKELGKPDRFIIQQIDFKPVASKPKLYPQFQSHKPGYAPWFIDEGEARVLLDDLDNVIHFAELVRDHPDLFEIHPPDKFPFLPATITKPLTYDQLEWRTVSSNPPPPDPVVQPQLFTLAPLVKLPQPAGSVWELIAFFSNAPIGDSPRPYFPKVGLGVDAKSGMILACHLSDASDTLSASAASSLVEAIQGSGSRPEVVKTDSLHLTQTLAQLAEALGIKILHEKSLPAATNARRSLETMLDNAPTP